MPGDSCGRTRRGQIGLLRKPMWDLSAENNIPGSVTLRGGVENVKERSPCLHAMDKEGGYPVGRVVNRNCCEAADSVLESFTDTAVAGACELCSWFFDVSTEVEVWGPVAGICNGSACTGPKKSSPEYMFDTAPQHRTAILIEPVPLHWGIAATRSDSPSFIASSNIFEESRSDVVVTLSSCTQHSPFFRTVHDLVLLLTRPAWQRPPRHLEELSVWVRLSPAHSSLPGEGDSAQVFKSDVMLPIFLLAIACIPVYEMNEGGMRAHESLGGPRTGTFVIPLPRNALRGGGWYCDPTMPDGVPGPTVGKPQGGSPLLISTGMGGFMAVTVDGHGVLFLSFTLAYYCHAMDNSVLEDSSSHDYATLPAARGEGMTTETTLVNLLTCIPIGMACCRTVGYALNEHDPIGKGASRMTASHSKPREIEDDAECDEKRSRPTYTALKRWKQSVSIKETVDVLASSQRKQMASRTVVGALPKACRVSLSLQRGHRARNDIRRASQLARQWQNHYTPGAPFTTFSEPQFHRSTASRPDSSSNGESAVLRPQFSRQVEKDTSETASRDLCIQLTRPQRRLEPLIEPDPSFEGRGFHLSLRWLLLLYVAVVLGVGVGAYVAAQHACIHRAGLATQQAHRAMQKEFHTMMGEMMSFQVLLTETMVALHNGAAVLEQYSRSKRWRISSAQFHCQVLALLDSAGVVSSLTYFPSDEEHLISLCRRAVTDNDMDWTTGKTQYYYHAFSQHVCKGGITDCVSSGYLSVHEWDGAQLKTLHPSSIPGLNESVGAPVSLSAFVTACERAVHATVLSPAKGSWRVIPSLGHGEPDLVMYVQALPAADVPSAFASYSPAAHIVSQLNWASPLVTQFATIPSETLAGARMMAFTVLPDADGGVQLALLFTNWLCDGADSDAFQLHPTDSADAIQQTAASVLQFNLSYVCDPLMHAALSSVDTRPLVDFALMHAAAAADTPTILGRSVSFAWLKRKAVLHYFPNHMNFNLMSASISLTSDGLPLVTVMTTNSTSLWSSSGLAEEIVSAGLIVCAVLVSGGLMAFVIVWGLRSPLSDATNTLAEVVTHFRLNEEPLSVPGTLYASKSTQKGNEYGVHLHASWLKEVREVGKALEDVRSCLERVEHSAFYGVTPHFRHTSSDGGASYSSLGVAHGSDKQKMQYSKDDDMEVESGETMTWQTWARIRHNKNDSYIKYVSQSVVGDSTINEARGDTEVVEPSVDCGTCRRAVSPPAPIPSCTRKIDALLQCTSVPLNRKPRVNQTELCYLTLLCVSVNFKVQKHHAECASELVEVFSSAAHTYDGRLDLFLPGIFHISFRAREPTHDHAIRGIECGMAIYQRLSPETRTGTAMVVDGGHYFCGTYGVPQHTCDSIWGRYTGEQLFRQQIKFGYRFLITDVLVPLVRSHFRVLPVDSVVLQSDTNPHRMGLYCLFQEPTHSLEEWKSFSCAFEHAFHTLVEQNYAHAMKQLDRISSSPHYPRYAYYWQKLCRAKTREAPQARAVTIDPLSGGWPGAGTCDAASEDPPLVVPFGTVNMMLGSLPGQVTSTLRVSSSSLETGP